MPEIPLTDWLSFERTHPGLHLLQMGEWGELKSTFGWEAIRIINGDFGAQILFRKLPFGLTIAYIPKPLSVHDSSKDSKLFWYEVDTICTKRHAIFCKIEPDRWIDSKGVSLPDGWLRSQYNIQPPRTIIVDLRESEDEILARMRQKCRYNIRLAEKKGVTVHSWDNLLEFHKMIKVTGGRDGFGVHSSEYYQRAYQLFHSENKCELLVAEFEGKPLAALMVFAVGNRAWYVYGASNDEERNRMPTYLLQWEAMRWAKTHGCQEYDLWGIPDETETILEANFENRQDGLWGVYRFKRGFGGEIKRAEQAYDRVYQPWLYRLYLWRMAGRESI